MCLDEDRMDQFKEQSTAYSDIIIDVLERLRHKPEFTDSSTEQEIELELQRFIQETVDNPDAFSEDHDEENEAGADEATVASRARSAKQISDNVNGAGLTFHLCWRQGTHRENTPNNVSA
ncbi:hypothetical protein B0H10DRAFT_1974056 [Mycena sp. CBHHK59/15]|nr:hypothetical protein B0H10DRAFT_1974056 [Mycena sp. CBHHK59/15]